MTGLRRTAMRRAGLSASHQLHGPLPLPLSHLASAIPAAGQRVPIVGDQDSPVLRVNRRPAVRLHRLQCDT